MGRVKDLEAAAGLFEEIFSFITVLRSQAKVHEVVELAAGENLTFYDASYLYTARAYKAKPVTEDKELLKFPKSIGVEQLLSELISSS